MNTEKHRSFLINFTYYALFLALGFLLLKYVLPILLPFVLGLCFAYFLRGPIRFMSRRLSIKHKTAALFTVSIFYITLGGLVSLIGVKAISSIQSMISMVPSIYDSLIRPALDTIFAYIEQLTLRLDPALFQFVDQWTAEIVQWLGQKAYSISMWAMSSASGLAASLPGLFIELLLTIISTFFIAADYNKLTSFVMAQLHGDAQALFHDIKEYLIGTLFVCIRSYLTIMSITFVELSIGLSILGIKNAVLISALIAVFDILPVLGTGGIMLPWAVAAALTSRLRLALGLFAVYLFVTVVRNIIEPKIVGGQLGLHPVITLASMFLGVQVLGVVGLFGFPIGLSLLRYLNDRGTIRLFTSPQPCCDGKDSSSS